MTDAQLAVLLSTLAGFGGAIFAALKWSVGRVVKALDENSEAARQQVHALGRVEASLELLTRRPQTDAYGRVPSDAQEQGRPSSRAPTSPLDDPDEPRPRVKTPVHGVRLPRRGYSDDS